MLFRSRVHLLHDRKCLGDRPAADGGHVVEGPAGDGGVRHVGAGVGIRKLVEDETELEKVFLGITTPTGAA